MFRTLTITAAVTATVLGLTACGSDDNTDRPTESAESWTQVLKVTDAINAKTTGNAATCTYLRHDGPGATDNLVDMGGMSAKQAKGLRYSFETQADHLGCPE